MSRRNAEKTVRRKVGRICETGEIIAYSRRVKELRMVTVLMINLMTISWRVSVN